MLGSTSWAILCSIARLCAGSQIAVGNGSPSSVGSGIPSGTYRPLPEGVSSQRGNNMGRGGWELGRRLRYVRIMDLSVCVFASHVFLVTQFLSPLDCLIYSRCVSFFPDCHVFKSPVCSVHVCRVYLLDVVCFPCSCYGFSPVIPVLKTVKRFSTFLSHSSQQIVTTVGYYGCQWLLSTFWFIQENIHTGLEQHKDE